MKWFYLWLSLPLGFHVIKIIVIVVANSKSQQTLKTTVLNPDITPWECGQWDVLGRERVGVTVVRH